MNPIWIQRGTHTVSASKVPNRSMAHEQHVLTRGTRGEENLVRHDVPVLQTAGAQVVLKAAVSVVDGLKKPMASP